MRVYFFPGIGAQRDEIEGGHEAGIALIVKKMDEMHVGSMVSPAFTYDGGKMKLDWRVYDAEIGPFLDGAAIAEGESSPIR